MDEFAKSKFKTVASVPLYVMEFMETVSKSADEDERARVLSGFLKARNLGASLPRVWKNARKLYFPSSHIKAPVPDGFAQRPVQRRHLSREKMLQFLEYMKKSQDPCALAVLLSIYTGYRRISIMNLKISQLLQLQERKPTIIMRSKGGEHMTMHMVYFDELQTLVDTIVDRVKPQVDLFRDLRVDTPVFSHTGGSIRITDCGLRYFINVAYNAATGERRPYGFGLHTARYYLAYQLYQAGRVSDAQMLLGHRHKRTTLRYLKPSILDEVQRVLGQKT